MQSSFPRKFERIQRNMKRATGFALLFPLLLLAGCFPVYKTLQPSASVRVLDDSGRPVTQAEVTMIASAYPYGLEKQRFIRATDNSGAASFPSISEWRVESIMLHGSETYFWNWCVRKDGYTTYATDFSSEAEFQQHLRLQMQKGVSGPCPQDRR